MCVNTAVAAYAMKHDSTGQWQQYSSPATLGQISWTLLSGFSTAGALTAATAAISGNFSAGTSTITGGITATGSVVPGGQGAAVAGFYSGTGVPTFSAPNASVYLRYDGATASTCVYVNSSGASTSGTTWTAITVP